MVAALRAANLVEEAEEVARSWPDTMDLRQAECLLQRRGITKDVLISRMGGSP